MAIWTLARKDLRVLLRDTRAAIILMAMPVIFILVLGLALGESFGQKPDDRLRISIVVEDEGLPPDHGPFPGKPWSEVVRDDLNQTGGVHVEVVPTRAEAEDLVRRGKRSAVLVFTPEFSRRVHNCWFIDDAYLKRVLKPPPAEPGLNPFYRDGVSLESLGVEVLEDPKQALAASIIRQVAQVSLMRVVLPWMIGRAFDMVVTVLPIAEKPTKQMFAKYNLRAKTWADLTKSDSGPAHDGKVSTYQPEASGLLNRGALRYQILVPSYTVMFAFFLVLTVGWLFVSERRQGTLLRLRAAPITRGQILLGKLLPCYFVSLAQGLFLLVAGWLIFGMKWGPYPGLVVLVVACTSLAAVGLSVLVASVARTESQVSIYGSLLVLVLGGVSGCLMPRDQMPEQMQRISQITPHAWALEAYQELLLPNPQLGSVFIACAVLAAFGVVFTTLAWRLMRLD